MNKRFIALIGVALILLAFVAVFTWGSFGTDLLWKISNGGSWLFPLVTVSALIDSINPCALSILLITIAFLISLGRSKSNILLIGGAYILGMFAVYVLIGLGILQVLHIFDTPHFMAKVGAGALILFGAINLIAHYFPNSPLKLKIPEFSKGKIAALMEKATLPAAFILGVLVGLCEFPCTGGPYLMVLGLLHDQGTYAKGLGYLFYYNLVFILPLVIILFIASNSVLLEKVRTWKRSETGSMKLWASIAMIGLGIIILML